MADQDNDQTSLYEEIGQTLLDELPAGWASVELTVHMIYFTAQFRCTLRMHDGSSQSVEAPGDLFDTFSNLREALYAPDRGAWYSAVFRMDSEGAFSVDYDYDSKPPLVAVDEDYLEDLEKFPRKPELIPSWFPARD